MQDILEGFGRSVKVGRRIVTNLRYADIVFIAGTMQELETLVTRVELTSEQVRTEAQYLKDKGYEDDW